MKINIQKIIRCLITFAVVCMVIVTALTPTAKAAVVAYNASDFVKVKVASGENLRVHYVFDTIIPEIVLYENDVVSDDFYPTPSTTGTSTVYPFEVATKPYVRSALIRMFMAGHRAYANSPAYNNGCIYVGDIIPGSPLQVSCGYKWYTISSSGQALMPLNDITVNFNIGMYYYGADGSYLGRYILTEKTVNYNEYDEPQSVYIDLTYEWVISQDVAYIAPFYDINVTWPQDAQEYSHWSFSVTAYPFTLTADVNMIYENSQTMDKVVDQLEELNDRMDEVISGGEAGAELEDESGKLDDAGDALGDAMSDYENAADALPTMPADVGEIVDADALDDALALGSSFMDWNRSGLNKMFVPLSLSVSLSVWFYVVFGRKG